MIYREKIIYRNNIIRFVINNTQYAYSNMYERSYY